MPDVYVTSQSLTHDGCVRDWSHVSVVLLCVEPVVCEVVAWPVLFLLVALTLQPDPRHQDQSDNKARLDYVETRHLESSMSTTNKDHVGINLPGLVSVTPGFNVPYAFEQTLFRERVVGEAIVTFRKIS